MKNKVKRQYRGSSLSLFFIICCLLMSACQTAYADTYGKTTASGVRLRKTASTKSGYWCYLPEDYYCAYTETKTDSAGVTWYKVIVPNPAQDVPSTYVGYLHGSYYEPVEDEEAAQAIIEMEGADDFSGAVGMVTNDEVNVRKKPRFKSPSLFKVDKGTMVELLSIPEDTDLDPWYFVRYNGQKGYIQGPFVRVVFRGQLASETAEPSGDSTEIVSYVTLNVSSCHLRVTPGGTVWGDWMPQGDSLPVRGEVVSQGRHLWYPVEYEGRILYVRDDCVNVTYADDTGNSSEKAR